MPNPYAAILDHPYPFWIPRTRMPRLQRAAQFAPFDALSGFTETITERARYTDQDAELDEAQRERLDQKTRLLMERIGERPYVTLHYFEPDERKSGGVCRTVSGRLYRIDLSRQAFYLEGKAPIPVSQIRGIE
ncbi:MAG: hypothetical protein SOU94_05765 [Acidaminococcus sp.]|nr:hypothetical protein [Acidaminococcus sp.]MDY2739316.1 hypothetical protein [Acidaminococcus sp.]